MNYAAWRQYPNAGFKYAATRCFEALAIGRGLYYGGKYVKCNLVKNIKSDGACFYQSIGRQLRPMLSAAQVKDALHDYVDSHFEQLREEYEPTFCETKQYYLDLLKKPKEWGGLEAIIAVQKKFRRNVLVFQYTQAPTKKLHIPPIDDAVDEQPLLLFYESQDHYMPLVPVEMNQQTQDNH